MKTNAKIPERSRKARKHIALGAVFIGVVLIGFFFLVALPYLTRVREQANQKICAKTLKGIGMLCLMYANDHRGNLPPDVQTILISQDMPSSIFICPSSRDTPATGATMEAIAENMATGGHLSYVYVGGGLNTSMPASTIVAYDAIGNHGSGSSAGGNVLYLDGTVAFFNLEAIGSPRQHLPTSESGKK